MYFDIYLKESNQLSNINPAILVLVLDAYKTDVHAPIDLPYK